MGLHEKLLLTVFLVGGILTTVGMLMDIYNDGFYTKWVRLIAVGGGFLASGVIMFLVYSLFMLWSAY